MHFPPRLRAATTAVASFATALAALSAVAPSAAADETLRTLTVQDWAGFAGVPSPAQVIDARQAGSTIVAWSRQWETSAVLGVQARGTGGRTQLDAELRLGAHDPLAPGTFEVTTMAQTPELGSGQAWFSAGNCNHQTGTVTIHELETTGAPGADQTVTRLALSWDCGSEPSDDATGQVRIASSYPVAVAVVSTTATVPASVVLDEPATSTLTYRNIGSETAHLGQVWIEAGTFAPDWSIASDGCSSATVAAGASCSVVVRVVPTELPSTASPPGPDYSSIDVMFSHDLDDDPLWSGAGVSVLRVLRPYPLSVTPMVDRTVLDWPYALNPAGTRVEYSEAPGPWQTLTTLTQGTLRAVDARPASATRRYRLVSVAPVGRPGVGGDPVSSSAPVTEELVLTERESLGNGPASLVSVDPSSGRQVRSAIGSVEVGPVSLNVDRGVIAWGSSTGSTARIRVRGLSETSGLGCALFCGETPVDPSVGPLARFAWTTAAGTVKVSGFGESVYREVVGLTTAQNPTWARDGATLLAASTTGGSLRSVQLDATGAAVPGTLVTVPGTEGAYRPSASPQADQVAFLTGSGASTQVRVSSHTGEGLRTAATVTDARHVSWTPDGTGLVVTTRGELGDSTVVRVDVATGARTTLYSTTAAVAGAVLRVVDREAPTITLGTPVVGRSTASGSIQVSDDTRPVGDLVISCVLDTGEVPCSTTTGWSGTTRVGSHKLTVTVSQAGRPATSASVQWETRTPQRKNDLDGDGNADLLSRDATGRLYLYPGDGRGSFKPRRAYGTGWNAMTSIMSSPDFDGDGDVDLLATDAAGTVFLYPGDGRGGLGARTMVATKMTGRVLAPGDMTGDGIDDLFWISTAGESYVVAGNGSSGIAYTSGQGRGWNNFTAVVTPGDLTGDHTPDLLVRDRTGRLHLYPVSPYGYLMTPVSYGLGWNAMTALVGPGDFTGDGKADLLARDTAGRLHMYPGNGAGGFHARVSYGTGWNAMTAIVG